MELRFSINAIAGGWYVWVRGVYQEFNSCPIKTLKLVNRKQNVEIAFGFKSYTAVSTFGKLLESYD